MFSFLITSSFSSIFKYSVYGFNLSASYIIFSHLTSDKRNYVYFPKYNKFLLGRRRFCDYISKYSLPTRVLSGRNLKCACRKIPTLFREAVRRSHSSLRPSLRGLRQCRHSKSASTGRFLQSNWQELFFHPQRPGYRMKRVVIIPPLHRLPPLRAVDVDRVPMSPISHGIWVQAIARDSCRVTSPASLGPRLAPGFPKPTGRSYLQTQCTTFSCQGCVYVLYLFPSSWSGDPSVRFRRSVRPAIAARNPSIEARRAAPVAKARRFFEPRRFGPRNCGAGGHDGKAGSPGNPEMVPQRLETIELCARRSWRDPAGGRPARVRGSARPLASDASSPATARAKRSRRSCGVWD